MIFIGFMFLAVGIMLMKRSELGLPPWGVLHQGLEVSTPLTFGRITQLVGLLVMLISMVFLKTKIGIGTLLNVIFVGWFIDLADYFFAYTPESLHSQTILLVLGIILMTFGRSLYISARLGSGPRDGLFVGLSHVTKIDVKYIKPTIEFIVLFVGFILGGEVGVGTVIAIVLNGYIVQGYMKIMRFDPKAKQDHNIFAYLKK